MRRRHRLLAKTPALLLALVMVLSACGDSADTTSIGSDATFPAATTVQGDGAPATTAAPAQSEAPDDEGRRVAALGAGGIGPVAQIPVDLGRDIIFTAKLTVAVDDLARAGSQATAEIDALGGFLFGQETVVGAEARSVLVFKILPDNFQLALDRLGAIGELRRQQVSADDVTERIVDLESQIETAAASVERLRELIENADGINAIVRIEEELLNRETKLEQLRGQLRTLENAVGLATITLTLTEALSQPGVELQVTAYEGAGENGASCPGERAIQVNQSDVATVCVEITNTGDTPLSGFTFSDNVLQVELADLTEVFGDASAVMEPGQSLVLSTEVTVERDIRSRSRFTAEPVNSLGEPIEGRSLTLSDSVILDAIDPGGLPSFTDGLSEGWSLLKDMAQVAVVALGWAIPFLWVPVVAWIIWRLLERRRRKRATLLPPPPTRAPPPPAPAEEAESEPAEVTEGSDSNDQTEGAGEPD